MGQVIDLPDPLHNDAPAAGPGVDDLLAQLAGEEIDRLLAEADVERQVQPPPVIIPPGAIAVDAELPLAAPLETSSIIAAPSAADPPQLHTEPQPQPPSQFATIPSKPLADADVEELDARVAEELNTLFTELDADESAPAQSSAAKPAPAKSTPLATPAPPAAPTPRELIDAAVAATPAAPIDPIAHAHELEKQVLGKTLMDALGGPIETPSVATRVRSINLSILLRPLEWANAPLNACSDTVRESLGKVAIMTLINALAILLYVMFLRKH